MTPCIQYTSEGPNWFSKLLTVCSRSIGSLVLKFNVLLLLRELGTKMKLKRCLGSH